MVETTTAPYMAPLPPILQALIPILESRTHTLATEGDETLSLLALEATKTLFDLGEPVPTHLALLKDSSIARGSLSSSPSPVPALHPPTTRHRAPVQVEVCQACQAAQVARCGGSITVYSPI